MSLFVAEEAVDGGPSLILLIKMVGIEELIEEIVNSCLVCGVFFPVCRDSRRAALQAHGMDAFKGVVDASFWVEPCELQCFSQLEGVALES